MTADIDDVDTVNGSPERPVWGNLAAQRRQVCRELATEDMTRAEIARKYGVHRSAVTQFAQAHASEIDAIRADLANEFAGLWIADKASRITAHQADYEQAASGDKAEHHEWIKARTQILHLVAEELGQLPPRQTVTVVPVQHVVVGVNMDTLR